MFERVEVPLHVAEVSLDIALHHWLDADVDAGTVDTPEPLSNRLSIDDNASEVTAGVRQPSHAQQRVTERLPNERGVLKRIVQGQIAGADQGLGRRLVVRTQFAEVDVQTGFFVAN